MVFSLNHGFKKSLEMVLIVFLLVQTEVATAMNLIGFKVCLASEMKAVVTHQGQPAAGATVTRVVKFDTKEYKTETQVDNTGHFVLPALYERTIWKNTPFETLIRQTVSIHYKGETHLGVETTKTNFEDIGELNYSVRLAKGEKLIPYEFNCELTDDEYGRNAGGTAALLFGKCLYLGENKQTTPKSIK
jgi:hypothetical protein